MTKIRIEIDDKLYEQYKEIAETKLLKVTKLNKTLIEKAIHEWMKENK